jgi:hypothetical protein
MQETDILGGVSQVDPWRAEGEQEREAHAGPNIALAARQAPATAIAPLFGVSVTSIAVQAPRRPRLPESTLQCPVAGQCIDHPSTIDLSWLFGSSSSNVALPPHSHILVDDESFQSAWWPIVVVGVYNRGAWNKIVAAKSEDAVQECQAAGNCTPDTPTNAFLFFQVLGPGMSPQGPG